MIGSNAVLRTKDAIRGITSFVFDSFGSNFATAVQTLHCGCDTSRMDTTNVPNGLVLIFIFIGLRWDG